MSPRIEDYSPQHKNIPFNFCWNAIKTSQRFPSFILGLDSWAGIASQKATYGKLGKPSPSHSWRPTALTLLAIAESSDPEIVERPGEMMRIANGYAIAGFPLLFTMLEGRGEDAALDFLCDEIEELVD